MKYDPKKIEKKWQKFWLENKTFRARDDSKKQKYYQLETFPYPSAEGLHVGHPKGYIAEDIHARYMRMNGREVLYTMGWDSFGLPTENYAIKVGKSPKEVAEANIKNFKRQVQMFGLSYDWDREINTSNPEYYKWTQWLFIELFKKGLAYRAKARVNWCPKDQTVLANEQVVNGKCERCGTEIEEREMEQWFFKITDYAERLLDGLRGLNWPEATVKRQKDWIGRSEGAEIDFEVKTGEKPNFVLIHGYKGSPNKHFFPWLKKELEKRGYKVQAPELPNPEGPRVYDQVEYVIKTVSFDENTIVLGHSLGSVIALKVLEKVKQPVRKTVLVGGFTENKFIDDDSFEQSTFDWKFDIKKISKNAGILLSLRDLTDDAVPQYQPLKLTEIFGGQSIDFKAVKPHARNSEEPEVLRNVLDTMAVFTTRPDTLFGATYMVLAPEHRLVKGLGSAIENVDEVNKYVEQAKHKTDLMRQEEAGEKTGVELKGVKAINPATKEEISIWIADYVLAGYGTGAIMAVPAHDERDYEFAKKFKLPIREVILQKFGKKKENALFRDSVAAVITRSSDNKILVLFNKKSGEHEIPGGGREGKDDDKTTLSREIMEETGYTDFKIEEYLGQIATNFFAVGRNEERTKRQKGYYVVLLSEKSVPLKPDTHEDFELRWMEPEEAIKKLDSNIHVCYESEFIKRFLNKKLICFVGDGELINSNKFSGMDSEKAKWEITKFVGGQKKARYKLRDWSVSRQRYWGVPIPMIYCGPPAGGCGWVPVEEKDLPVLLPELKNYRPKGMPPLASDKKFISTACPKCGGKAERSAETLDTFVDSSWYYLRYTDPKNGEAPFDAKKAEHWLPVDLYVIGAEHTVLHLLYSRFITKFLRDAGYIKFEEPFLKLRHQGLILGTDGKYKMSKSKGNVVNPDPLIEEFGADTVRLYEMFMGPFEEGAPWDPKGILGANRFLNRFWNYFNQQIANREAQSVKENRNSTQLIHKTIKKVGEDIENFKFNTAISALMILLNELEKQGDLPFALCVSLVKLLHPFAPHMAQELWEMMGSKSILDLEKWPEYDEKLVREEKFILVIQINGKVRDSVEVSADISEADAQKIALERDRIKNILGMQKPKKTIYVPKKLINIVV